MRNKNILFEVISKAVYFLNFYLLIVTTNKVFFTMLLGIYIVKYTLIINNFIIVNCNFKKEMLNNTDLTSEETKAVVQLNRSSRGVILFYTSLLVFILIYRYLMWFK